MDHQWRGRQVLFRRVSSVAGDAEAGRNRALLLQALDGRGWSSSLVSAGVDMIQAPSGALEEQVTPLMFGMTRGLA